MTRRARAAAVAAASVALAAGGVVGTAAPALAHEPTVKVVTIDCVGDSIVGHAGLGDPGAGTATVTLYGQAAGASTFTVIGVTHVATSPGVTEIGYSFTLAAHTHRYEVSVQVGSSTKFSMQINDDSCAPPVEVSEAGLAASVPVVLGAVGGLVWWRRRRRPAAG